MSTFLLQLSMFLLIQPFETLDPMCELYENSLFSHSLFLSYNGVVITMVSKEALKLLKKAAFDSVIECGGCGINLEPDCDICGECGWENPLVKEGLI